MNLVRKVRRVIIHNGKELLEALWKLWLPAF
jgi:hypothetical protein